MIRKMVCQYTTNCPATQALKALDERLPAPETLKRARMLCKNTEQQKPSLKKQRCALDLSDMVLHIQPVEESIAFPTIEWSYDDDDTPFDTGKHRSSSFDLFPSTASNNEQISTCYGHRPRSSSARLGGKRARGESLVRSSGKGVCLVSLLNHTISSDALSADCMSACLNAQKLPIFSLSSNNNESPPTYGAIANESVCLALSQLVA